MAENCLAVLCVQLTDASITLRICPKLAALPLVRCDNLTIPSIRTVIANCEDVTDKSNYVLLRPGAGRAPLRVDGRAGDVDHVHVAESKTPTDAIAVSRLPP